LNKGDAYDAVMQGSHTAFFVDETTETASVLPSVSGASRYHGMQI
jgi:hypothetical protein